jgi:ketosteroid isomerase-like protein
MAKKAVKAKKTVAKARGTKAKKTVAKARATKAKKKPAAKARPKKAAPKRTVQTKRPPARRVAAAVRPPAPRPDPIRELAKRIIDVTLRNDDEATLALYADSIESIERGGPPMVGIEAIRQKFGMWRGMTSSAVFRVRKITVDGNTIMIEWEGDVTLSPSGKQVLLEEVAVHEIEDGKIVRERFYYDPSLMQQ